MTHYEKLNLSSFATIDDINLSYEKLKEEENNQDILNDIEKAYQVLSDFNSRRMYDNTMNSQEVIAFNDDTFIEESINDTYLSDEKLKLERMLMDMNNRLENIERKINNQQINFFRETINTTTIYKKGCKIITIDVEINDNGVKSIKRTTKYYNKDGRYKKTTYNDIEK